MNTLNTNGQVAISRRVEGLRNFLLMALAVAGVMLFAIGCAGRFKDGYDFGDVTLTVLEARFVYCNASTQEQRDMAKEQLRAHLGAYPDGGICGD